MFGVSMVGAVAAEMREAGVVEDDHHDVRRGSGRRRRGRPPGLGVGERAADAAAEGGFAETHEVSSSLRAGQG